MLTLSTIVNDSLSLFSPLVIIPLCEDGAVFHNYKTYYGCHYVKLIFVDLKIHHPLPSIIGAVDQLGTELTYT